MKNTDVIRAFVKGYGGKKAKNLRVEDGKLYSYETAIAMWVCGVVHIDSTYYSPTTTRHTNELVKLLNKERIPHMEYPFYKRGE